MNDFLLNTLSWVWFTLWYALYFLYWTWPLYWITWPTTAILLYTAGQEYKKTGGSIKGVLVAIRYVAANLPIVLQSIVRWFLNQIFFVIRMSTGEDIAAKLPLRVRNWLDDRSGEIPNQPRPETRTITIYRDRPTTRFRKLSVIVAAFEEIGTGLSGIVLVLMLFRLFA